MHVFTYVHSNVLGSGVGPFYGGQNVRHPINHKVMGDEREQNRRNSPPKKEKAAPSIFLVPKETIVSQFKLGFNGFLSLFLFVFLICVCIYSIYIDRHVCYFLLQLTVNLGSGSFRKCGKGNGYTTTTTTTTHEMCVWSIELGLR